MKRNNQPRVLRTAILAAILGGTATLALGHGWQITPLSRTEYLYRNHIGSDSVNYEPQSVNNTNRDYQSLGNKLCYAANAPFSRLNEPLPDAKTVPINYNSSVAFSWFLTAVHVPSHYDVYVTDYPEGQYSPTPNFNQLKKICTYEKPSTSATDNWSCIMPSTSQGNKQVMVTIWQRTFSSSEYFVSCSDINFNGTFVTPTPTASPTPSPIPYCGGISEWNSNLAYSAKAQVYQNNIIYEANWWSQNSSPADHSGTAREWKQIGTCSGSGTPTPTPTPSVIPSPSPSPIPSPSPSPIPSPSPVPTATPSGLWTQVASSNWLATLGTVKAKTQVTFTLFENSNMLGKYTIAVSSANLKTWESTLAAKINNDTPLQGVVKIGVLNSQSQAISYTSGTNNYVYSNNEVAQKNIYSYTLDQAPTTITVKNVWTPIGDPIANWLMGIKKNDQLYFSLVRNGVEIDTFNAVTITNVAKSATQLNSALRKHVYPNSIKVALGVLNGTSVSFAESYNNLLYIYTPNNDYNQYQYIIRRNTVTPTPSPSPVPSPSPSPIASPTPQPSPTPVASPTPQPTPTPGGVLCSSFTAWKSGATYIANDVVAYNGYVYKANWWTQNNPAQFSGVSGSGQPWTKIQACQ